MKNDPSPQSIIVQESLAKPANILKSDMRSPVFVALVALITSVCASTSFANSTACADVHFVLARGTTESYPGTPYSLASLVAQNTTLRTNYENIIYPAVSEDTSDSYFIGRAAVGAQMTAYARRCPQSQIVVLSYSQGALIVGDALAGGGGNSTLGKATPPLIPQDVAKRSMWASTRITQCRVMF